VTDTTEPVAPYLAVGLSTVVHGVGERKHIERNLAIVEDGIHAAMSVIGINMPVRVIALADGRVALDGSPQDVFRSGDELERIRLALPPVPVLAERLRRDGLPLASSIFTVQQLEDALTQLARKRPQASERVDGAH